MDASRGTLSPPLVASGPLDTLPGLIDALAWDIAALGPGAPPLTREELLALRGGVSPDGFKAYGLGLTVRPFAARTQALRRSVVLDRAHDDGRIALGRLLLQQRQLSAAEAALGHVKPTSPLSRAARFLEGVARLEIGRRCGLIDESRWDFLWVVDAPMFEPDGEGGYVLDVDLKLEPGETRLPHCPLP